MTRVRVVNPCCTNRIGRGYRVKCITENCFCPILKTRAFSIGFFYSFLIFFFQILSEFHAKANRRKCIKFSLARVNEWAFVFPGNLSKSQLHSLPSFNRKRVIRLGRQRFSGADTPSFTNKTFILRNGLWGGDNNTKRATALRGISRVLMISSVTVAR